MIIDSPVISGSLANSGSFSQVGNVSITGSLTVTGDINGNITGSAVSASQAVSASYATSASQAISASYSLSSSYAATASYAANVPVTASYANQANSASYALTASYISGSGMGVGFPFSGAAVITGSLLITNLTGSGVRYVVADANGNMTAQTASAAIKTTQAVVSTAGQTVFNITNGYTTGLVDVFINGTKLNDDEFTDTNGTSITLATGSNVDDIVEFVKYLPASGVTNNVLRQLTSFTATAAQTVFTVDYTPGLLDIYYNGARLTNSDYTAANGTSITLATASAAGDILDVMVYSYQVGAMNGIGGQGVAGQIAYYNTTNSITGSPNFSIVGNTINVTGSFIVSSSATFTNIGPTVFSGSVTSTTGFTGSFSGSMSGTATSASAAISSSYATSASAAVSSSYATSASAAVSAASATSASYALNASTAANSTLFENTASVRFATTGSNNFTAPQHVTDLTVPAGFADTSGSIYTDGGLLISKDSYFSGSVFIKGNVTVYGTQSIAYITSSQLNISTNVITVNTATPSVRFGGLSVYDSGSTGTGMTGSLFWDSQNNGWVYSNPSGSGAYDSSMVIMGPRNATGLGNEQGINCNYLVQGHGHHHVTSSMIFHDGSTTCLPGVIAVGGVATFSSTIKTYGATQFWYNNVFRGQIIDYNAYGGGGDYSPFITSETSLAFGVGGNATKALNITSTGVSTFSSCIITGGDVIVCNNNIKTFSNSYGSTGLLRMYGTDGVEKYQQGLTTGGDFYQYTFSGLNHIFYTNNGSERMRITSGGNVGIGTVSPSQILHIYGGSIRPTIQSTNNGGYSSLRYLGNNSVGGAVAFETGVNITSDNSWEITNGSTSFLSVKTNGNVGIGTTTPDNSYQGLTIYGSDPSLRLKTSSASGWVWTEYVNNSGTNNFSMGVNQTSPYFGIKAGAGMDSVHFLMNSSGKIGINTGASTYSQLNVGGSVMINRSKYNWYQGYWTGNSTYWHMKTNLDSGSNGNVAYTMSLFRGDFYSYSDPSAKTGSVGFHNWSGTMHQVAYNGNLFANVYNSADGYVVLVIPSGAGETGVTIDWHQAYGYPFREAQVTAAKLHGATTGGY